jgi:ATP-binding cassette subfamily B protein
VSVLVIGGPMSVVANAAALLLYSGALLMASGWAAAVLLLVPPPLWLITRVFAHRIRTATQDVRQQASRTMSMAEEAFSDLPSIQASARAEAEEQQYADRLQDYVRARLHQIWPRALNGPAIGLLGTAMGLVLVWLGANQIEEGPMTLGELVAALGYVRSLYHLPFALARLTGHL